MKSRTLLRTSIAIIASSLFTAVALAGPGPEYWRNPGKADKAAVTVAPVARAARACIDARMVTVTETKPSWQNGRGPLVTTEVGKKLECTSCDRPMVVMKPSGHNGRGAIAPVEIKGTHDCSKNACAPAAVASID